MTGTTTTISHGRRSDDPAFDPYPGKERVAELIALGLMPEPKEPEPKEGERK